MIAWSSNKSNSLKETSFFSGIDIPHLALVSRTDEIRRYGRFLQLISAILQPKPSSILTGQRHLYTENPTATAPRNPHQALGITR